MYYYAPTISTVWATPESDELLAYIARVSNPDNQRNENVEGLLKFMMREGHVSPFDMCNMNLEINVPRDIARQVLRHSSIKPQEFSQRYAAVLDTLGGLVLREFRTQHPTDRQLSVDVDSDDPRHAEWHKKQVAVAAAVQDAYSWCLTNGGAKEVARIVLPEGMTPSRLYMNGRYRDWIFYLKERLKPSTQKEHRWAAELVLAEFRKNAPVTARTFFPED